MKNLLIVTLLFGSLSLVSQNLDSGETYAVVVGISDYQDDAIPDLRFADKDAEAFANFLRSPAGGSLDVDHLKVLLNEQATGAQIAMELDWLIEVAQAGDRAIIYFSGHGDVEAKRVTQPGYLLGWDSPARVYMAGGAVNLRDLQIISSTLSIENQAKVIIITDACRAGKLAGSAINGSQIVGSNLSKTVDNEIKILSCQPNEYSVEGEQWGGGRGAFSYHLLDGLFGLADGNEDLNVNLKEIGRYLEDKVTEEVSPLSQNPIIVGDKTELISSVLPNVLEKIRTGQKRQLQIFAATDPRGIEDEVLDSVDSIIRQTYFAFKQSLKEKRFLQPIDDCADTFYKILIKEPEIKRLHSTLKRNYAAALQDDAQQAINDYLKTNNIVFEKRNELDTSYFRFPKYLNRAAELLGEEHYIYKNLKAKEFYFEGLLVRLKREYNSRQTGAPWDTIDTNIALLLQFKAHKINSQAAFINHEIALLYRSKGNQEKALEFTSISSQLAPTWGLTHLYYANDLNSNGYKTKSISVFKKAIELSPNYSEAYSELGGLYMELEELDSAKLWMEKAIEVDSTRFWNYGNLALLYSKIGDLKNYEYYSRKMLQKAAQNIHFQKLSFFHLLNSLKLQEKFKSALETIDLWIKIEPNTIGLYYEKAVLYSQANMNQQAIQQLELVIKMGFDDYYHIQKDQNLKNIRGLPKYDLLIQKYFPNQHKK